MLELVSLAFIAVTSWLWAEYLSQTGWTGMSAGLAYAAGVYVAWRITHYIGAWNAGRRMA